MITKNHTSKLETKLGSPSNISYLEKVKSFNSRVKFSKLLELQLWRHQQINFAEKNVMKFLANFMNKIIYEIFGKFYEQNLAKFFI